MSDALKPVDVYAIDDNAFRLIADDWMLITAGELSSFNTMTASWGALGELWHRKVAFCFVRPTRHTYGFMERADLFTLSFFPEQYRHVLNFCGTKSGREVDKVQATGITPVADETGGVFFAEARLVLVCRKLYTHDLAPERFLDESVNKEYPEKDFHRMYIGQVIRCLMK